MRFAVLLVLLAGPAHAACVTTSDMERGVEATYADGTSATLVRQVGGTVRMDERPAGGGPVVRSLLARGFWEVRSFEVDAEGWPVDESRLETLYSDEPEALPGPEPGLVWVGTNTPVFEGTTLASEPMVVEAVATEPLTLGECRYEAVEVRARIGGTPDTAVALRYLHLPRLGAALLVERQAAGEPVEVRTPVALTALR